MIEKVTLAAVPLPTHHEMEYSKYYFLDEARELVLDRSEIRVLSQFGNARLGNSAAKLPEGAEASGRWVKESVSQSVLRRDGVPAIGERDPAYQAVVEELLAKDAGFVSPKFVAREGLAIHLYPTIMVGFKPGSSLEEQHALLRAIPNAVGYQRIGSGGEGYSGMADFAVSDALTYSLEAIDASWPIAAPIEMVAVLVNLKHGFAVLELANRLHEMDGFVFVEPGFESGTRSSTFNPGSNPYYGTIWNVNVEGTPTTLQTGWELNNSGINDAMNGFDIRAYGAWAINGTANPFLGKSSVRVAIFDDGVQQDHPDINQRPGLNFVSHLSGGGNGGPISDTDKHGTTVAGIVSGKHNTIGSLGVCPQCEVMSFKVLPRASNQHLANAITASANDHHCRVSVSSFGMASSSTVANAYKNTRNIKNVLHFAASGNANMEFIDFPAGVDGVIAVGATTRFGSRWSNGEFGSNYGSALDFVAPGDLILVTDRTGADGYDPEGDYAISSGTSYSTPSAAGIAALILSRNHALTWSQVYNLMRDTARDIGASGWDMFHGHGQPRAENALTATVKGLWHDNVTDNGGGSFASIWFGAFHHLASFSLPEGGTRVYHSTLGELMTSSTSQSSIHFWEPSLGWFFTGNAHYPWIYRYSDSYWYYYYVGTSSPRWFTRSDGLAVAF